jgi:uncharacterized protein (TIGR00156 family)
MKKYTAFFVCCLVTYFTAAAVFAQQGSGFTGPAAPGTANRPEQAQAVTVAQLDTVPNKNYVILTGNIVQSVGRENYTFRHSTGEITVEMDRKYWQGFSVGPYDTVEIIAKVEKKLFGKIEAEAKGIRRL